MWGQMGCCCCCCCRRRRRCRRFCCSLAGGCITCKRVEGERGDTASAPLEEEAGLTEGGVRSTKEDERIQAQIRKFIRGCFFGCAVQRRWEGGRHLCRSSECGGRLLPPPRCIGVGTRCKSGHRLSEANASSELGAGVGGGGLRSLKVRTRSSRGGNWMGSCRC